MKPERELFFHHALFPVSSKVLSAFGSLHAGYREGVWMVVVVAAGETGNITVLDPRAIVVRRKAFEIEVEYNPRRDWPSPSGEFAKWLTQHPQWGDLTPEFLAEWTPRIVDAFEREGHS